MWVDSVSPKATTAESLLASFCKDCLLAFKRQMRSEERCIQHLSWREEGRVALPSPRRSYRKR